MCGTHGFQVFGALACAKVLCVSKPDGMPQWPGMECGGCVLQSGTVGVYVSRHGERRLVDTREVISMSEGKVMSSICHRRKVVKNRADKNVRESYRVSQQLMGFPSRERAREGAALHREVHYSTVLPMRLP